MAIVEALRAAFDGAYSSDPQFTAFGVNRPLPRRIDIEYAETEEDWPFLLVQIRPTDISWTGVMPDVESEEEPTRSIRQGKFEASVMLEILALTSVERDRMWDMLVNLLLFGRKRSASNDFYASIEAQDLIGITIMEGSIRPIGDTISQGAPWDPEVVTYEASVEFDMVGTFYADEYTEELVPITQIVVLNYIPDAGEAPPEEGDGDGEWEDPFLP